QYDFSPYSLCLRLTSQRISQVHRVLANLVIVQLQIPDLSCKRKPFSRLIAVSVSNRSFELLDLRFKRAKQRIYIRFVLVGKRPLALCVNLDGGAPELECAICAGYCHERTLFLRLSLQECESLFGPVFSIREFGSEANFLVLQRRYFVLVFRVERLPLLDF